VTPSADDLNRGVAAVHEALEPLVELLEHPIAVAIRDLAARCARDLEAGLTAAAAPGWEGPDPEALTERLRRRHDEAWRSRHEGRVERVQVEAMRRTYDAMGAALGVDLTLRNPVLDGQVRQLRNRSTLPESAWLDVRESLQRSADAGDGIREASRRLRTDVGGMSGYRSRMIARTELVGIANRGSITAARLAGVGGFKTWQATNDARTRAAHALAHGQTVPLDDTFSVMGEAMDYPGDPIGSAANVIHCRCTVTYSDSPDGTNLPMAEPAGAELGPAPVVEAVEIRGSSIRDTVQVQRFTAARAVDVEATLDNIDRLHGVPGPVSARLPIEQGGKTKKRGGAYFQMRGPRGLQPQKIRLNKLEPGGPEFTDRIMLAHEYGHFLDHWHLPNVRGDLNGGGWSSTEAALLARRTDRVAESAREELGDVGRAWVGVFRSIFASAHHDRLLGVQGSFGSYLRSPEELWARAYSQWVGTRSGDSAMISGYEGALARSSPDTDRWGRGLNHWPADDFEPIADAIDGLFRAMGVLRA
jgi:hypothetical protein